MFDIFDSTITMFNKCLVVGYILLIFVSFYYSSVLEMKKLIVFFLFVDALIILSMISLISQILGEVFILKVSMAIVSLAILQFLIIQYSKISRSARTNRLPEKKIEEVEDIDKKRKENLERLFSLVGFKISNLSHNLKVPAPSVDLQVMVNNNSIFDIKLRKFIYKPTLLGMRGGTLSERTYDHEIEIPHQSSNWFDTEFMIPEGIATYLENCKRQANGGKHGRLAWRLRCTAYFLGPDGEFNLKQKINYFKEWYEIELPRKRAV